MSKVVKQMQMDAIKSTLSGVRDLVVLSFKGLNSQTDGLFRANLRKKKVRLQVVKNSYTRRVFKEAEKAGVGRIIVINKMDEHNVDFPALIERIRDTFGNQCVLFNVPIGHGGDFKGVVGTLKPPGSERKTPSADEGGRG